VQLEAKRELVDLLFLFQHSKLYVEKIPQRFTEKIRTNYQIPQNEQVLAFLDNTILRTGGSGIVFSSGGIYWSDAVTGKDKLTWDELKQIFHFTIDKNSTVHLDSNKQLNIGATEYPPERFIELLQTIKVYLHLPNSQILNPSKGLYLDPQTIKEISSKFLAKSNTSFSVAPNLDNKKVKNFVKKSNIDFLDEVIGFIDTTIFNTGASGIAILKSGLYFNEKFLTIYLPWEILEVSNFSLVSSNIEINHADNIFHLQNTKMSIEDLNKLLNLLQEESKKVKRETGY
jgi:hypothetical protein